MAFVNDMAASVVKHSPLLSSRSVALPLISELFDTNFLDDLIPTSAHDMEVEVPLPAAPKNPTMEALKTTSHRTYTNNGARAYSSTLDPVLDAFNGMTHHLYGAQVAQYLSDSWQENPNITLRLIWNLRSIHDGVGDKELFYRAFGWLYDNHPRTAISNLHNLLTPVCVSKKKEGGKTHGYWKDLLNILALATVDELSNISEESKFLHAPRMPFTYGKNKGVKVGTPKSRIDENLRASQNAKAEADVARKAKYAEYSSRLTHKLTQPKFRALYIMVARLFADQLIKDMKILSEIQALPSGVDRLPLVKKLSLAAKWAPTPGLSHDRVTNISTAIAELIYASQSLPVGSFPSALQSALPTHERAVLLRSFYQRWILTELRNVCGYPEPLMSAGKWKQIKYERVSSLSMKNNTPHFFKHDTDRFENYLTSVEENKKSINGATLLPHKIVAQVMEASLLPSDNKKGTHATQEFRKKLAQTKLRVSEAQWKSLLDSLREAGTIENSLAVCDVSGSMGNLDNIASKSWAPPILPAISLSLVLASIAKPPFAGGFITFSSRPQYITVDLAKPLYEQVAHMGRADWGYNTDMRATFLDLLLPLAIKHKIRQEDMVKRLFVFSDMQFDECAGSAGAGKWETNYDYIAAAYGRAGYEMPQIVYWDLAAATGNRTVEVEGTRKGVAMMNGFSPAMLKVFMGEEEERQEDAETVDMEWENVGADGESVTVVEKGGNFKEEFTPVNVMKKALMRASYDGLVVVD